MLRFSGVVRSTGMMRHSSVVRTSGLKKVSRVVRCSCMVRSPSVMRNAGEMSGTRVMRGASVVRTSRVMGCLGVKAVPSMAVGGSVSEAISSILLARAVSTTAIREGTVPSGVRRWEVTGCIIAHVAVVSRSSCGRPGNLVEKLVSPAVTARRPPSNAAGEERSFDHEED